MDDENKTHGKGNNELYGYLLLEAAPDAMILVNREGKILYVNSQAEKLFDYKKDELLGQEIEILVPEVLCSKHQQHRSDYFKHPRTRPMGIGLELQGRKKNGELISVEINLSPIEGKEGLVVLAAVRDITERKLLETQNIWMRESNRIKDILLTNISHEFRTPLNGIIGFAELMYSEMVGPVSNEQKEYLSDIISSTRHILSLIKSILDFSEIELGQIKFHPEQVNLTKLIDEVVMSIRDLVENKKISLTLNVEPSMVTAYLDPLRFEQILYNYLSNAIKFTPNQGHIEIRIKSETQETFRLEVEDNGIGIQPEELENLFSGFRQLNSGTAKKYSGIGIGLPLNKHIVEALGGRVGVISSCGKGSIFYAILPKNQTI